MSNGIDVVGFSNDVKASTPKKRVRLTKEQREANCWRWSMRSWSRLRKRPQRRKPAACAWVRAEGNFNGRPSAACF